LEDLEMSNMTRPVDLNAIITSLRTFPSGRASLCR
jgi:hypothetical protein